MNTESHWPEDQKRSGRGKTAPTIAQLRAFIASLDAGSVTGGADLLDMTQSAVSHAISGLEEILGISLMKRGRSGVTVSEPGAKVAVHARRILQHLEAMEQDAAQAQGEVTGHLRVASFRSAATHILPTLIVRFNQRHPGVSVSVQSLEGASRGVEQAVASGRADVGIVPLPVSPDLSHWEIARDDWVVLCPRNRRFAAETLDWSVLEAEPFIICNEGGAVDVRAYFTRHGKSVRVVGQVDDDSVIMSMVAHGLAWSTLPRIAVEPLPDEILVRRLPSPFERIIGVVVAPGMERAPVTSEFLRLVRTPEELANCSVVQRGFVRPSRLARR